CDETDTPATCAGKLVDGAGKPLDDPGAGWRLRELLCLKKSAKMLHKLARSGARCQHRSAHDASFDLAGCLDGVVARSQDRLETAVTGFEDTGAAAVRCLLGGCDVDDDASTCVDQVLNGTGDDPSMPDGPDGPDDPGNPDQPNNDEMQCRQDAAVILKEL